MNLNNESVHEVVHMTLENTLNMDLGMPVPRFVREIAYWAVYMAVDDDACGSVNWTVNWIRR